MHSKISIVTPTFNQGKFIEQTIDSVLSQNYPALEYIIIDGGSSDNTVEIIKKFQKHLRYWVSEKDRGQSDAINKGYAYCTGDIFNWLNSDDYLEPHTLKLIGEEFLNPAVKIVAGTTRIINENTCKTTSFKTALFKSLAKTIARPFFFQPSTFIRNNESLKRAMPVSDKLHYAMDTELYIKYLLQEGNESIKVVDDVFANYRIHENSKTGAFNEKFAIDIKSIFYNLALLLKNQDDANIILRLDNTEILKGYSFDVNFEVDPALINAVNANYIFRHIVELYGNDNFDKEQLIQLTEGLKSDMLEEQDRIVFNKIKTRLQYYPYLRQIKAIKKWLKD